MGPENLLSNKFLWDVDAAGLGTQFESRRIRQKELRISDLVIDH